MKKILTQQILDCVVCSRPIQGKYIYDEWGNNAHAGHSISFCSSCNQIISQKSTGGGVQHPDGRTICRKCYKVSVKTDKQVKQAYDYVIDLLKEVGFKDLPNNISIHLIDKVEMKKLSGSSETLGLARIMKYGGGFKNEYASSSINILNHLPAVYFKGVLAHELLHVWVSSQNIRMGQYEEALCNIGSTLIYNTNKNQYLSDYLNERMKINDDPNYGIRHLELKSKLKELGWKRFIEEIKRKY